MMLFYQLKDFKKVDALLNKCFLFDSRSVAIKAVRMFKNQDPACEKYLAKKCRKFKHYLNGSLFLQILFLTGLYYTNMSFMTKTIKK